LKRQDKLLLVTAAIVAAFISLLLSHLLFNSPEKHNEKVPVVQSIVTSFPDIKNDPAYNVIFNSNALDPTQTVQIGGSNNAAPFNGQ
jgi:hypothetical protein